MTPDPVLAKANRLFADSLMSFASAADARRFRSTTYKKEHDAIVERTKASLALTLTAETKLAGVSNIHCPSYVVINDSFFSDPTIVQTGSYELIIPAEELIDMLGKDAYDDLCLVYNLSIALGQNAKETEYGSAQIYIAESFRKLIFDQVAQLVIPVCYDIINHRIVLFAGFTRLGLVGVMR